MTVLPSRRSYDIAIQAPSTARHRLHAPPLPPPTAEAGPSQGFLQLPRYKHHVRAATPAPSKRCCPSPGTNQRFSLPGSITRSHAATKDWDSPEPSSSSAFLPPPARSHCVILLPFPRSCIAATAVEQNHHGLLFTAAGLRARGGGRQRETRVKRIPRACCLGPLLSVRSAACFACNEGISKNSHVRASQPVHSPVWSPKSSLGF